jgi:uncharacterized protein (TIRG00374 family)
MADEIAIPRAGPSPKEIVRYLIGIIIGFAVLLLLFGKRGELAPDWHQLSHARLDWVAAAIGAEALSLLTYAYLQYLILKLSGASIPLGPLTAVTLANDAIANSVPGGSAVGSAYRYRFYRRSGASAASSGWTIFTVLIAQAVGMSLLLLIGVLVALGGGAGTRDIGVTIVGLVIVVAAMAVLVRRDLILRLAQALSRAAGRAAGRQRASATPGTAGTDGLAARIEATFARMREIPLSASATMWIVTVAAAVWAADFGCLVCAFGAIGAAVPWYGVLLAYGVAQVAGSLPVVPGGIGIIEGSLAIILISYGASRPSALAAAIVYRVVSFWLCLAVGWISAGVIAQRRRG